MKKLITIALLIATSLVCMSQVAPPPASVGDFEFYDYKRIDNPFHYKNSKENKKSVENAIHKGKIRGKEGWVISSKNYTFGVANGKAFSYSKKEGFRYDDALSENFCGVLETHELNSREKKRDINISELPMEKCIKVDVHVDSKAASNFSTVDECADYIQFLMSIVSTIYGNQGMNLSMSSLTIWDDPETDYFKDVTHSNIGLDAICDYASYYGINGDIIQLMSGGGSGGLAWVNSLFSPPNRRCSYARIYSYANPYPNYSWDALVVTHEIGHNIGSHHTHSCVWNGNNTAIDGCAGYVQGTCELPPMPEEAGTIMSYCHARSVGSKLEFHPQPAALLQSRINERGSDCNPACPAPVIKDINLGTNTMDISWFVVDEATSYEIAVTGSNQFNTNTTDNSLQYTGLQPSTAYTIELYALCGGEQSVSTKRVVKTPCNESIGVPYTENFNTGIGDFSIYSISNAASSFQASNANINTGGTYNKEEHSFLESPCINFSYVTNAQISFDILLDMETQFDGMLLSYNDGTGWQKLESDWYIRTAYTFSGLGNVWTGHGANSIPYQTMSEDISFLAGLPSVRFRFELASDNIQEIGMGVIIDNFSITTTDTPGCETIYYEYTTKSCDTSYTTIDTFNLNGCDSIVTHNVELAPSYDITTTKYTCYPEKAGTNFYTFTTQDGCDSNVTEIVILLPSYDFHIYEETCNQSEVGTFVNNFTTVDGCDSVITRHVSLVPSHDTSITELTCDPSLVGTEIYSFTNQYGCDSIVTVNTTLDDCTVPCESPTGLYTEQVNNKTKRLRWSPSENATEYYVQVEAIRRKGNGAPDVGDYVTSNNYLEVPVKRNTNYRFRVKAICDNQASDFSYWYDYSYTQEYISFDDYSLLEDIDRLIIQPNPTRSEVNIRVLGEVNYKSTVIVRGLNGDLVAASDKTNTVIDMSQYPSGIYIVTLYVDSQLVKTELLYLTK